MSPNIHYSCKIIIAILARAYRVVLYPLSRVVYSEHSRVQFTDEIGAAEAVSELFAVGYDLIILCSL